VVAMKKCFLILFVSMIATQVLASSKEVPLKEEDTKPKVTTVTIQQYEDLLKSHQSLSATVQALKTDNDQMKQTVTALNQLLVDHPGHRRVQRVGMAIWLPTGLAGLYYIGTRDMATSLAIASYGMSILLLLLSNAYRFDDSFYPVQQKKK
jgi:hypothetical protein